MDYHAIHESFHIGQTWQENIGGGSLICDISLCSGLVGQIGLACDDLLGWMQEIAQ